LMNSLPMLLPTEPALRVLFFWVLAALAASQLSSLSVLGFFGRVSGAVPCKPFAPPDGAAPAALLAEGEATSCKRRAAACGLESLSLEAGVGASKGEIVCEGCEGERQMLQHDPGESPNGHIARLGDNWSPEGPLPPRHRGL